MRTVRRLYFYLVAMISLEVVIWGVISLARTLFDTPAGTFMGSMIATGLSLLLVGLPIFLLHWIVSQREAQRDDEERATRIRALFLYGVRLAVLIPAAQNLLALISRLVFSLLGQSYSLALIGANQTTADNLVAIAANLVAGAYFERILRADWKSGIPDGSLRDVRRLFRYVWSVYTLGLAVAGVVYLLSFIFYLPGMFNDGAFAWLANGIALVGVMTPLWMWMWTGIQKSLADEREKLSSLRLVILYLLVLAGVATTLSAGGTLLASLLRWLFGESHTLAGFLSEFNVPLALLIPFGVLWAYFNRELRSSIAAQDDPLRRAMLWRFYYYFLSLIGNATVFIGALSLLNLLANMLLGGLTSMELLRAPLAAALAELAVGLPLWLRAWLPVQGEVKMQNELAEHARRSIIRKIYLYLVLLLTVVGVMISAGMVFYLLLNTVLGIPPDNFALDFTQRLLAFLLVSIWLGYHFWALRQDGVQAQRALSNRHAAYPLLVLQSGFTQPFVAELVRALQRRAPGLPVTVRQEGEALDESLAGTQVVVMPASLAMNAPDALKEWLSTFSGQRILVPLPLSGLTWLGVPTRSTADLAKETAAAVCSLAEGHAIRTSPSTNPWAVVGYVLGALFALEILLSLLGIVLSSVMG